MDHDAVRCPNCGSVQIQVEKIRVLFTLPLSTRNIRAAERFRPKAWTIRVQRRLYVLSNPNLSRLH